MGRKRILVGAGFGAMAIALLLAAILASGAMMEMDNVRRGVDEGFELRGTYQQVGARPCKAAFQEWEGEDRQWQAIGPQGDISEGTYKPTADPNFYVLMDENGEEAGWAHLAYANTKGEGTLYLCLGDDDPMKIPKYSRDPVMQSSQ